MQPNLELYIDAKIVGGKPMDKKTFHETIRKGIWTEPNEPGYYVIYEDGYESWSPKEVFERCYRKVVRSEKTIFLQFM